MFLLIGFCWFSIAFIDDIEQNLRNMSADLVAQNGKSKIEKRIKMKTQFSDAIQFHGEAKELSCLLI